MSVRQAADNQTCNYTWQNCLVMGVLKYIKKLISALWKERENPAVMTVW